jgi:hypothetical protein
MNRTDPILAAGVNNCHVCLAVGYPTNATWLGEDQILATYAAPCEHVGESTHVLAPSQLRPLAKQYPTRCMGITASDTWCRNRPRAGNRYCARHQDQGADAGQARY